MQQERLGRPRDALRTLSRALAVDPARAPTRKAMEGAAARADAFLELARAYRSAAGSPGADAKTRKTLQRRVAEIYDRDLGKPEEAARAWRELLEADPGDRGAAAGLEACLARAGQQGDLARDVEDRRAHATGEERRALSAKLARLHHDAARFDRIMREGVSTQAEVIRVGRTRGENARRVVSYRYTVEAQTYGGYTTLGKRDRRTPWRSAGVAVLLALALSGCMAGAPGGPFRRSGGMAVAGPAVFAVSAKAPDGCCDTECPVKASGIEAAAGVAVAAVK